MKRAMSLLTAIGLLAGMTTLPTLAQDKMDGSGKMSGKMHDGKMMKGKMSRKKMMAHKKMNSKMMHKNMMHDKMMHDKMSGKM